MTTEELLAAFQRALKERGEAGVLLLGYNLVDVNNMFRLFPQYVKAA